MRTKLQRFKAIEQHPRVIQAQHPLHDTIKGNWKSDFFHNQNPITLELACGYGEYTIGLAQHYPEKNFIGVDIKGERFYHGLIKAQEYGLQNVGFLRTIIQNIEQHIAPQEIDDIWIIHPDPYPKGADERRRLTYTRFLDIYHRLLSNGGLLRLKTDDHDLRHYSVQSLANHGGRELIDSTTDLHSSALIDHHHGIMTRYEHRGIKRGRTICYGMWKKI